MKSNLTAYILAAVVAGIIFLIVLFNVLNEGNIKNTEHNFHSQITATKARDKYEPADKRPNAFVDASFNNRLATDEQLSPESQMTIVETVPAPAMTEPPFYHIDQEKFSELDESKQNAISGVMEEYISYYKEYCKSSEPNSVEWNRHMREVEEQIRIQIGPDAADKVFH